MKGKAGSRKITQPTRPKAPEDRNFKSVKKNINQPVAEAESESEEEEPRPKPRAKTVQEPEKRIRELPYVDVPPLTRISRADRPRTVENTGPAYVTRAPVEKDNLTKEILEEILSATLDVTIAQVLGTAPNVRKELVKKLAKVRRTPEENNEDQRRVQFKATVEEIDEDEKDEVEILIPNGGISLDDLPYAPCIPRSTTEERRGLVITGDPVVQYMNSLAQGESPKQIYAVEGSLALRAIYPLVNNVGSEEALLDSGSQIVSMSREAAVALGLTWNPDITINMQSAQGHVEKTLGLAKNVPFQFSGITVLLQVHIINKPAYKILLGRPFDALTESVIRNEGDGMQIVTITDPATQQRVVIPTYPRGLPPKAATPNSVASFRSSMI
jgi:hypothetical protein